MRIHSCFCQMLALCIVVPAGISSLEAEETRGGIKKLNPVPHISKGLQSVGSFFSRVAKKLEGEEAPKPAPPPAVKKKPRPVPAKPKPQPVDPTDQDADGNPAPQPEGSSTVFAPSPESTAGESGSSTVLAPSDQPATPPAGKPAGDAQTTASNDAEKQAAAVNHPYGKPVPGRPGLVYVPGVKESPENMIDVRGIEPGTKVRDPVTKIIFLVP